MAILQHRSGWQALNGLKGLLISCSAATFAIAQPVYNLVASNPELRDVDRPALLYSMLAFQIAPTAVLFATDRAIACTTLAEKGLRLYRTALFVITFLSMFRQAQMFYLGGQPLIVRYVLLVAVPALVILLCSYGYRAMSLFFVYLSPVAILLAGIFVYQVGLFHDAGQYQYNERGYSKQASDRYAVPVFIVLFDGLNREVLLKDGKIDGQRFPNFKALAEDSVWFTNATTNYIMTRFAIPSLLTGTYISPEDRRTFGGFTIDGFRQKNILTILSRRFNITVHGEYFNYCFDRTFLCRGVPYAIRNSPHAYLWRAGTIVLSALVPTLRFQALPPALVSSSVQKFEMFVDNIRASDAQGRVYFHHSLLPHPPLIYDEKGNLHNSPHTDFPYTDYSEKKQYLPRVYDNYARQVMLVDSLLGRFIARLKSEGLYDRAVIVVTSDHGIFVARFLPFGGRFPDEINDSAVRVPLLIRAPGLKPHVSDVDYQHIDFKPTLLDVLGVTVDEGEMAGVSALAKRRPVRDKALFVFLPGPPTARAFLLFESGPRRVGSDGVGGVYLYDSKTRTWRRSPIPIDPFLSMQSRRKQE